MLYIIMMNSHHCYKIFLYTKYFMLELGPQKVDTTRISSIRGNSSSLCEQRDSPRTVDPRNSFLLIHKWGK